ncbi:MAG: hypothetical protein ABFD16_04665 [Thermoguttaceae bacterium]
MTLPAGLNRTNGGRAPRRGAAVVVAIVCLVVAATIFLTLVRTMIAQRDSVEASAWRIQATWLAESGLERAAARLAADSAYRGETWTLAAEQLDAHNAAVVRIEVQPVADSPNARQVRVQADFPNHPEHRARQTKEAVVHVP